MKRLKAKTNYWAREIAAVLLVIMLGLALGSMWQDSTTMDEIAHIPAGYTYAKFHDYHLNPEHPPLAKLMSGLPLAFLDLNFDETLPAWSEEVNGQWGVGWHFLYGSDNDPDLITRVARLPMLILMLLMGVFTYLWSRRFFGVYASLIATFFVALSPNLIAHSRYVTTDIAATLGLLATLYFYLQFLKKPSWKLLGISMLALSTAQLLKYSDFVLYFMMGLMFLGAILFRKEALPKGFFFEWIFKWRWLKKTVVYAGSFTLMTLGSFVVIAIVYQLTMYNTPVEKLYDLINVELNRDGARFMQPILRQLAENPLTRSFGHWLLGLAMVFLRVSSGNTTYFLGEVSNSSWREFYPVAILLKTPIPTLIWTAIGIGTSGWFFTRFIKNTVATLPVGLWPRIKHIWEKVGDGFWNNYEKWTALMVIVVFLGTGILGNLNIGLRHVLPFYPFWFILLSGLIVWLYMKTRGGARVAFIGMASVLFIWYAAANIIAFPSYLSYFNESIGGNENGYHYLVDSNLDWGQDLRRLEAFVERNNIEKISVDYFGGGLPEYYLGDRYIEYHAPDGPRTGWIAISATFYQNSKYYGPRNNELDYSWLDSYEPEAVIGNSILVFNITELP